MSIALQTNLACVVELHNGEKSRVEKLLLELKGDNAFGFPLEIKSWNAQSQNRWDLALKFWPGSTDNQSLWVIPGLRDHQENKPMCQNVIDFVESKTTFSDKFTDFHDLDFHEIKVIYIITFVVERARRTNNQSCKITVCSVLVRLFA